MQVTEATMSGDSSIISSVLDGFLHCQFEIKAVWAKQNFVPARLRLFVDFWAEHLAKSPGIAPSDAFRARWTNES
jgi:hypothetical protein